MIKSINQWSFPPAMSVRQCIETALAEGFEAVEPTITVWYAPENWTSNKDRRSMINSPKGAGEDGKLIQ